MSRVARERAPTVHLVGSLGGHLELLEQVAPLFADSRRIWVTSEGARAESLRQRGEEVKTLPRLDRSHVSVRRLVAGISMALRDRPSLVVTSGAGLVVPFALVARALGARLVFLETMARVTGGSATGRILSRFASDVLVQWPELSAQYPTAAICRPTLLEGVTSVGPAGGRGTFVTVGSHDQGFERMLDAVDRAARAGLLPTPVIAQSGVTAIDPYSFACTEFVSPEQFKDEVANARLVICHGGAGAISTVLRAGKRPLVMARRKGLGEHVDDHQMDLVSKLSRLGLVVQFEGDISEGDLDLAERAASLPEELVRLPTMRERLSTALPALQG